MPFSEWVGEGGLGGRDEKQNIIFFFLSNVVNFMSRSEDESPQRPTVNGKTDKREEEKCKCLFSFVLRERYLPVHPCEPSAVSNGRGKKTKIKKK